MLEFNEMDKVAQGMQQDLMDLASKKLYMSAHAHHATMAQPVDHILVEGIKNLSSTGRFKPEDREAVNCVIRKHVDKHNGKIKLLTADPCMHNAIITFN